MTPDEEFLKLAQDMGGDIEPGVVLRDENFVSFSEDNFLTYSREIERRALERAAKEIEPFDAEPISFKSAARLIRAMIKEKE